MVTTLGEAYPREQERCRELLATYKELGPVGSFGAAAISDVLRRADAAVISGDLAQMIALYQEMKGCE